MSSRSASPPSRISSTPRPPLLPWSFPLFFFSPPLSFSFIFSSSLPLPFLLLSFSSFPALSISFLLLLHVVRFIFGYRRWFVLDVRCSVRHLSSFANRCALVSCDACMCWFSINEAVFLIRRSSCGVKVLLTSSMTSSSCRALAVARANCSSSSRCPSLASNSPSSPSLRVRPFSSFSMILLSQY